MTAWPKVRAALASQLPALLPTVTVYNGPVVSGDSPAAYLTVGHQPSTGDETSGSYEQSHRGVGGFLAEEEGVVLLEVGAVTGDPYVPDAFGMADAIHAWVQADQTLGVLSQGSTASTSVEVLEIQNAAGAVQRLLITLSYFTRIERTT